MSLGHQIVIKKQITIGWSSIAGFFLPTAGKKPKNIEILNENQSNSPVLRSGHVLILERSVHVSIYPLERV